MVPATLLPAAGDGNRTSMSLPTVLDEIERLFDELVRRPWGAASRQLTPATFREVKDGWVVELPVEGLRAADLRVEVRGRVLTVLGYRHSQAKTRAVQARRDLVVYRTLTLPREVRPEDVEAAIEDSTLTIHVRRNRS